MESKVALVTGGDTGIGRAIARRLAEEGARVIATGRSEGALKESAAQHAGITPLVSDGVRPEDAARAVDEVRRRHGRLGILVNHAAVAPVVRLSDAAPSTSANVFEVNVFGLIELTRRALPLLREGERVIVNLAGSPELVDQDYVPAVTVHLSSHAELAPGATNGCASAAAIENPE